MSLNEGIGLFGKSSRTMDVLWCDVMLIQGNTSMYLFAGVFVFTFTGI